MKWNEAAVIAAIQSLPARTNGRAMSTDEALLMMKFAVFSGTANTASRARPATRKQTLADLRKLCDLCRNLYEHIEHGMRSPALRMVEANIRAGKDERARKGQRPLYHPLLLNIQLEGMFEAARTAWMQAKEGAELPQPHNRGTKPGARDIATAAAHVFEGVTGEPAARSYNAYTGREGGAFVTFLGAVFDALGVKARAAGQAKLLMERRGQKIA